MTKVKTIARAVAAASALTVAAGEIQANALEEIIVTAAKREQNMQEIPIAMHSRQE